MTIETVEQVVGLLNEYSVSEITLEQEGSRVFVRRTATAAASSGAATLVSTDPEQELSAEASPLELEPLLLTAPMVGLFHHLASPIRYGGSVTAGQLVGHIESMKLMNDVQADTAGRIMEVLVEDGTPVEYGQPLFRVTP